MIVPPYKWSEKEAGGFVRVRTPLISKPNPEQEAAFEKADMSLYHDGLNAINQQPWRVNGRMLRVLENMGSRWWCCRRTFPQQQGHAPEAKRHRGQH